MQQLCALNMFQAASPASWNRFPVRWSRLTVQKMLSLIRKFLSNTSTLPGDHPAQTPEAALTDHPVRSSLSTPVSKSQR
jgi:hypothetical protein